MAHSIATVQCLAKLQEPKKLLSQVEAVQKKVAVLNAWLGSWLDEAYLISAKI